MREKELLKAIADMRAEVARLSERVAALEPKAAAVAAEEKTPDELILVLSAAVAAFLGKRAHIRSVRLVSSTPWAQQGRVSIQASHLLDH